VRVAFILPAALFLMACDSGTEERAEVASTRVVQRSYLPVPPGTVPRGTAAHMAAVAPPGPEVTPSLVHRGRERFLAFCSPCHGGSGQGNGTVVSRGFPRPPSYHEDRIRAYSPAQIVTVITEGKGLMYSYADRVPPEDRWAIAHYVKVLQDQEGSVSSDGRPALP
jgi:mono/diheme cytochrome c family protein